METDVYFWRYALLLVPATREEALICTWYIAAACWRKHNTFFKRISREIQLTFSIEISIKIAIIGSF